MKNNSVRIISGKWKGRKLKFPNAAGLRPTADRTRETLFNWLAPHLAGARVLDLFAGSGALGLEAASRGARQVDLVESQRAALKQLRDSAATLDATEVRIHARDAERFLRDTTQPYDLVFVDPPFQSELASTVLRRLHEHRQRLLSAGAIVYVEVSRHSNLRATNWNVLRDRPFGDSRALLLSVQGAAETDGSPV